jgi:hypothetical protein
MLSSEFWPDFLPAGKDFTIPAPKFPTGRNSTFRIAEIGVTQALPPVQQACNASAKAQAGVPVLLAPRAAFPGPLQMRR